MDLPEFKLSCITERAPPPRPIHTRDGIGDRLRAAAYAEVQAIRGFKWAAAIFQDAPPALRARWLMLAGEEKKHMGWLLTRLEELGFDRKERPVSDGLFRSFLKCADAAQFSVYMATAEDRGRQAGERFFFDLHESDRKTAEIFYQIATEEREHIRLSLEYYETETLTKLPHLKRLFAT